MMFAGTFAPRGWAFCSGQLLPIAQNTALFSILGTTYGGNGQTTFALPDLRGRAPVHGGQGPGLSTYTIGEQGGTESVTLLSTQMPAHTHTLQADQNAADSTDPAAHLMGNIGVGQTPTQYSSGSANTAMNPTSIGPAGGSQPHANMQPFLCVNFIIALEGIYPSRN